MTDHVLSGGKMTIRYSNGQTIEAVLLSRTENLLRAAARGSEDIVELTQVNGSWITDDCEPVQVTFEWQRQARVEEVSLEECLCSPELAARLMQLLYTSSDEDAPVVTPIKEAVLTAGSYPVV
jgi:hypothetical protein